MCQSFYELILARFQFDKAISWSVIANSIRKLISETRCLTQPLTGMRHQFSKLSKFNGILGLLVF